MGVSPAVVATRSVPRVCFVFLFLLSLYLVHNSWPLQRQEFRTPPSSSPSAPTIEPVSRVEDSTNQQPTSLTDGVSVVDTPTISPPSCRNVPGADKIMLIIKTGATEIYEKLPIHLTTIVPCAKHHMIFSDLAQSFGGFEIHDALANVSTYTREHHRDFSLYHKVQQFQREGQDAALLKGQQGWDLDKWKFLPMMHLAYENADPEIEWFVFMEADTSLSWINLLQWLATMDSSLPIYRGNSARIGDTTFAHGGSGFIVSRPAASRLAHARAQVGAQDYDERWERATGASCCGDVILAAALHGVGVPLQNAWPMMQGETLTSIDWTSQNWCSPAISWHHVSPMQVDQIWNFQKQWAEAHHWNVPYQFRDVFEHFIDRHISVNRASWDNFSGDRILTNDTSAPEDDGSLKLTQPSGEDVMAITSEQGCVDACNRRAQCIQWMFRPGWCWLSGIMRFGHSEEHGKDSRTAGWMYDRMAGFKKARETCPMEWRHDTGT